MPADSLTPYEIWRRKMEARHALRRDPRRGCLGFNRNGNYLCPHCGRLFLSHKVDGRSNAPNAEAHVDACFKRVLKEEA